MKAQKMQKVILLNLAVLLPASPSAPAATPLAPSEYTTIQPRIDAAGDGDIVIVIAGTCFGNINLVTRILTFLH